MPSHLRLQSSFEPFSAETTRSHFVTSPPPKKQKMSLTQTYYIAASARTKLGREAGRPDHDLRLLVGHANLLDSLMVELADAEREQEAWFNQSVKKAAKADEPRHIQWVDRIVEEQDDEDTASDTSDSDSDSDFDESDLDMVLSLRRAQAPAVHISSHEVDDDEDEDEYVDDEYDEEHALARTPSAQSPPELVHDDESDDDTPPASPPSTSIEYSEEQRQAIATTSFYDKTISEHNTLAKDGFFAQQRAAPMIASF